MSEKRFLVEKSRWRALGRAASRVPRLSGGVVGARQRDVGCVFSLQNESKPCRKRVHLVQTWKSHPSGRSWTQLKVSVLCFDLVSDWLWACERLYGCDHSGFLWVCPAQTLQVYGHILLLVSCFCVYFSNIKWNNNPVISRSASVSFSFLCLFLNFIYVLFYWWMFTENGQSFRTNVGVCKGDLCERRAQTFFFYPWIFMMSVSADIPCMVISAFQFRLWAQKPN